jgi:tRNA(fMet)-specific endonuclease VapC
MIVLDTDTLTLFDHGNTNVLRKVAMIGDEPLVITVVTRNEALLGRASNLLKAADEAELKIAVERLLHTEKLLASLRIVGIDDAAIAHFGRLRKQKNLKKIGRPDLLIA